MFKKAVESWASTPTRTTRSYARRRTYYIAYQTPPPPPHTHKHSGTGYKTEAPGKKAFDDCYVPAGYASSKTATGWVATPCPADTYGSDTPIFGVRTIICTSW